MLYLRALILFTALFLGYRFQVNGQLYFPEDMVKVNGHVVDESTGDKIPYVQVVNFRVHGSTMTDVDGNFTIQADPSDTLTFKIFVIFAKTFPLFHLKISES